jgi:hypothetical protein
MPRAAELEIFVGYGEFVAIENDLGIAALARAASEQFVLPALTELAQVSVDAVGRGHAGIVFLDAPAHFLDQPLLQRRGMAKQALGVGVFGFQIFTDIRIQDRRIAQHLLPVFILQPRIIVDDRNAVGGESVRAARRDRRGALLVHRLLTSNAAEAKVHIGSQDADCQRCGLRASPPC